MALTRLELQSRADEECVRVELIYRRNMAQIEDPDGYCFNGEFRIPQDNEVFLNRAREAAIKTPQMQITTPRLILIEYNAHPTKASLVVKAAQEKLDLAYQNKLSPRVAGCLAGVSTRTASIWYERFEMRDWRRERANV